MPAARLPLPALRPCASCAEQTDSNLHCANCYTLYCSRECQLTDWTSGGHKQACAGLAHGYHDTDLEAQSRALAHVSRMSGGAPDDARCLICLDGADAAEPLVRGCACRGSSGWTHVTCLVKSAEAARALPPPEPHFAPWISCSTCKQKFTGLVQLRLVIALWAKFARAVETDVERTVAVSTYAVALNEAGEHAEAARLQQGILDVVTRALGPEHRATLICAGDLAFSLLRLGECADAAALLRTTLAALTRTLGTDNQTTLSIEGVLVNALHHQGEHAEAEAVGRGTLEKRRRVLGRDHHDTLVSAGNLASSLTEQGKSAEAVEIEREVLASTTRLLGAEHESTLTSATNLAVSLRHCGQNTECEQIFRDTLALARRALGPTHELTQKILARMRGLYLLAR